MLVRKKEKIYSKRVITKLPCGKGEKDCNI